MPCITHRLCCLRAVCCRRDALLLDYTYRNMRLPSCYLYIYTVLVLVMPAGRQQLHWSTPTTVVHSALSYVTVWGQHCWVWCYTLCSTPTTLELDKWMDGQIPTDTHLRMSTQQDKPCIYELGVASRPYVSRINDAHTESYGSMVCPRPRRTANPLGLRTVCWKLAPTLKKVQSIHVGVDNLHRCERTISYFEAWFVGVCAKPGHIPRFSVFPNPRSRLKLWNRFAFCLSGRAKRSAQG